LIAHGRQLLDGERGFVSFAGNHQADALVKDLDKHPHAFVLGCVMDRQIRTQKAWLIPYEVEKKLGDFSFSTLSALSLSTLREIMMKPTPLHRFPEEMARNFHEAVLLIRDRYNGNAARIWMEKPPSAEVVLRFLQFRGIGPKIATIAANILAREIRIPFSDYHSVDISPDVHVRRVFRRLGLVSDKATAEELVYKARSLHPEYPGLLDNPAFEIGRNWCRPRNPKCGECYMSDLCPREGLRE